MGLPVEYCRLGGPLEVPGYLLLEQHIAVLQPESFFFYPVGGMPLHPNRLAAVV